MTFNFNLFSSDGSRRITNQINQNKVLLHYSKRSCRGIGPEYDLWIFTDGKVLYEEVYESEHGKEIMGVLSREEIYDLTILLKKDLDSSEHVKNVRGFPVTILKFKGRELEYHASIIDGALKTVDNKIEYLLGKLQMGIPALL
ncbi:hypothetical protein ATE84_5305 [Aquimarina sp. MAR_2010_214]|nr:hypothetical protein ATE84_5305 [Aquimarina sp. MAR_2010_214]